MLVAVLCETQAGEARVALVPDSVKKLVALKASVAIEIGAGCGAGAMDNEYLNGGAEVVRDRAVLLATADVLVAVNRPSADARCSGCGGDVREHRAAHQSARRSRLHAGTRDDPRR